MLGAQNTSLLHKLGQKQAHELSFDQLCLLVTQAQSARTLARSVGRAQKMLTDPERKPKKVARKKASSLSSLENFFDATLCLKLRTKNKGADGKSLSDFQIIQLLQQKGLL